MLREADDLGRIRIVWVVCKPRLHGEPVERLGTGIGYLVPDAWLLGLEVLLVLPRDLSDPAALPAMVVAGGFAAIIALFALLVTETEETFGTSTQRPCRSRISSREHRRRG